VNATFRLGDSASLKRAVEEADDAALVPGRLRRKGVRVAAVRPPEARRLARRIAVDMVELFSTGPVLGLDEQHLTRDLGGQLG
jgi:hypothetical protein